MAVPSSPILVSPAPFHFRSSFPYWLRRLKSCSTHTLPPILLPPTASPSIRAVALCTLVALHRPPVALHCALVALRAHWLPSGGPASSYPQGHPLCTPVPHSFSRPLLESVMCTAGLEASWPSPSARPPPSTRPAPSTRLCSLSTWATSAQATPYLPRVGHTAYPGTPHPSTLREASPSTSPSTLSVYPGQTLSVCPGQTLSDF